MAIKIGIGIGKYRLHIPYEQFWSEGTELNGIEILPIELRHTRSLISLPFHHRDPFDGLLVAQSLTDGLPIISCYAALDAYGARRLW